MFSSAGYFRGTTILISGTAGTGKTSFAASFVDAACRRGERCLYFAFEEAANQVTRNMRSVGIDFQVWVQSGLLRIQSIRPTLYSLEMHLALIYKHILDFNPQIVILDPVTNFDTIGNLDDARVMLTRLTDFLKRRGITALLTSLANPNSSLGETEVQIASVMDSWLLLRTLETNGERNRILQILKSRGMAHSNQVSEYKITNEGIQIIETYLGSSEVLTGSARIAQGVLERTADLGRQRDIERKQLQLNRKRTLIENQMASLQAELQIEDEEMQLTLDQLSREQKSIQQGVLEMARMRQVNNPAGIVLDKENGSAK
jgi:circadian clock protein KaiC